MLGLTKGTLYFTPTKFDIWYFLTTPPFHTVQVLVLHIFCTKSTKFNISRLSHVCHNVEKCIVRGLQSDPVLQHQQSASTQYKISAHVSSNISCLKCVLTVFITPETWFLSFLRVFLKMWRYREKTLHFWIVLSRILVTDLSVILW